MMGAMATPASTPPAMSEAAAERLAAVMQGLASPLRLRILDTLRSGPATVSELCERLDAGQTTMSNHLRLLRTLELVSSERDGRNIRYALYDDHVAEVFDQAVHHLGHAGHQH